MWRMIWILVSLALTSPALAREAESVDTLLVLAVDVSDSVNEHRWNVQREGYAAAFRDPEVLQALRDRRVAVTFMQWSSCAEQEQSVGWRVLRTDADALGFADDVAGVTRRFNQGTAIGAALVYGKGLIDTAPVTARRRIIDISGDGIEHDYDDYGLLAIDLAGGRRSVVDARIVINGLPIKMRPPNYDAHNVDIDRYYERQVIGGEGSFIEVVHDGDDPEAFRRALIRKLLRELIASLE